MTLFRTINGVVAWFDNSGNPINPDGSPRSGPTLADAGGADGTYPDASFAPDGIVAPAPTVSIHQAPPASDADRFVNLDVIVSDVDSGAALSFARVVLTRNDGTEQTVFTDANGFANAGVVVGEPIVYTVTDTGYASYQNHLTVTGPTTIRVALLTTNLAGRKARIGTPVPVQDLTGGTGSGGPGGGGASGGGRAPVPAGEIGELTPTPTGLAGTAPAPSGYARATFETRFGVPSITAESFALLDIPGFGVSPAGIFQSIVGSLLGLFKSNSGAAEISRLTGIVQKIGDLLLQTASTLADLTARSVHTDAQGGRLFDHILGGVLGPIINALAALIRGGSSDLGKLFGPISDALKKVLDKVRHLYDTWLKPILHVIDVTRQILRILAAFHLDFARDLDAQLGKLEGKITAPYLKLVREINHGRNVVNRIVTLDGTLQRVTLLQSIVKHSGCVNNVWWNSHASKPGQYAKQELDPAPPMMTADEFSDAVGAAVYDDGGPFAAEAKRLDALVSELSA